MYLKNHKMTKKGGMREERLDKASCVPPAFSSCCRQAFDMPCASQALHVSRVVMHLLLLNFTFLKILTLFLLIENPNFNYVDAFNAYYVHKFPKPNFCLLGYIVFNSYLLTFTLPLLRPT